MTLQEALESLTVAQLKQRLAQMPAAGGSSTRKDSLIATINGYLLSDALSALVGRLSELDTDAVAETVHNWHGQFDAVGFQAKYGRLPSHFTRDPYDFFGRRAAAPLPSLLQVLFYDKRIPDDLATHLARLLPAPPELRVPTLDDDQLPQSAGARMTARIRAQDTVARTGGDEFMLILPDLKAPEDAAKIAAKLVNGFSAGFELQGSLLTVTASVGVGLYPDDGVQDDALIEQADRAMYHAKRLGRSGYQLAGETLPVG